MDTWTPLFHIFLNSPCPESEASLWLTKSFNSSSNTTAISTTSFLLLLTKQSDTTLLHSCSSPQQKKVMWIQTLPDLVQARILSFLAYDHQRFCKKELCKLARIMLSEDKGLDFWVKKAAQQLLDLVSVSNYQWLSHLNLDSEEENVEDEFYTVPDWLKNAAKDSKPLFPWLPLSPDELNTKMPFNLNEGNGDGSPVDVEDEKQDELMEEIDGDELEFDDPMGTEVEHKAKVLKASLLSLGSASKAVELANEIRDLCLENRRNSLTILNFIEPWSVDDEIAAVLISHLSDESEGDELGWASHVLCSVVLPKLLILNEPCSRVLISAIIHYCKSHQRAAEYALLFPLILRIEGLNNPICEVITKIVKECLHSAQVSSFCQKLLCKDKDEHKIICLSSHRCLISDEVVWTESLFSLFQNMLKLNIQLTQDSVDQLVHLVCKFADKYSKSLKFSNFLLCLVNKCSPLLKSHKLLLIKAVENTNTLVTKSVLSKLSGL